MVRVRARARQRDSGETRSARERGRPEVFDESLQEGSSGTSVLRELADTLARSAWCRRVALFRCFSTFLSSSSTITSSTSSTTTSSSSSSPPSVGVDTHARARSGRKCCVHAGVCMCVSSLVWCARLCSQSSPFLRRRAPFRRTAAAAAAVLRQP